MTLAPNWGKLFADVATAVAKAIDDIKHNRHPRVSGTPMTDAEKLAKLKALAAHLPTFIALFEKYQIGIDDVLEALRKNNITWAGDLEKFLNELPADAEKLEGWIPTIEWAMTAFQPAPGKFIGIR